MNPIPDIQFIHQSIKQLEAQDEFAPLLQHMLEVGIEILGADRGTLQLYDEKRDALTIEAHVGFNQQFLAHFRTVTPGVACCGVALKRKQRVVIEDVHSDPEFPHLRATFREYGYASVQSTPIFSGANRVIAVISTHFVLAHRMTVAELTMFDLFVQRCAPLIEAKIPVHG